MRVLLFESDIRFVAELKEGFHDLGFEVDVVSDGERGLRSAQHRRPDIILLSADLPTMNGYVVCKKIRKDQFLRDIPLVLLSGEPNAPEIFKQHQKLRTRADVYLGKPISFSKIVDEVSPLLNLGTPEPEDSADFSGPSILQAFGSDDDDEEEEQTREFSIMDMSQLDEEEEIDIDSESIDEEIETYSADGFDEIVLEEEEEDKDTVNAYSPAPKTEVTMNPWDERGDAPRMKPSGPAAPMIAKRSQAPRSTRPAVISTTDDDTQVDESRVRDLELQVQRLKQELHTSQKQSEEAKRYEGEVDSLRSELNAAHAELSRAHSSTSNSSSEIANLKKQLVEAKNAAAEVESLRAELEKARSRPNVSIPPSGGDSIELRSKINQKDKENLQLQERIHNQQRELIEVRDRALDFERQNALLNTTVQELQDFVQGVESKVAERDGQLKELKGKLTEAGAELEMTRQKAEEDMEDMTSRFKELYRSKEAVDAQKAELEENLSGAETRVKLLTETKRKLEGELQDKTTKLEEYARSVGELHEAVQRASEIAASLRRRDSISAPKRDTMEEDDSSSGSVFPVLGETASFEA